MILPPSGYSAKQQKAFDMNFIAAINVKEIFVCSWMTEILSKYIYIYMLTLFSENNTFLRCQLRELK